MKEENGIKIRSLKHKLECVVLGACIQEQNNFGKIQKYLLRTDFGANNMVVFDALQNLHENSKPIDLISVSTQMLSEINATKYSENGSYVKINQYLINLTSLISNTSNLEYYALQLAQLSTHHQLLEQLHILLQNKSLPTEFLDDLSDIRSELLPFNCDPLLTLDKAVRLFSIKYPNNSELYQSILNIENDLKLRIMDIQKDFEVEATNSSNKFLENFMPDAIKTEHWPETFCDSTFSKTPF